MAGHYKMAQMMVATLLVMLMFSMPASSLPLPQVDILNAMSASIVVTCEGGTVKKGQHFMLPGEHYTFPVPADALSTKLFCNFVWVQKQNMFIVWAPPLSPYGRFSTAVIIVSGGQPLGGSTGLHQAHQETKYGMSLTAGTSSFK